MQNYIKKIKCSLFSDEDLINEFNNWSEKQKHKRVHGAVGRKNILMVAYDEGRLELVDVLKQHIDYTTLYQEFYIKEVINQYNLLDFISLFGIPAGHEVAFSEVIYRAFLNLDVDDEIDIIKAILPFVTSDNIDNIKLAGITIFEKILGCFREGRILEFKILKEFIKCKKQKFDDFVWFLRFLSRVKHTKDEIFELLNIILTINPSLLTEKRETVFRKDTVITCLVKDMDDSYRVDASAIYILQCLEQLGYDFNMLLPDGSTCLSVATDSFTLGALLDMGVKYDWVNKDGVCIIKRIIKDYPKLLSALLSRNIGFDYVDKDTGNTLILALCLRGKLPADLILSTITKMLEICPQLVNHRNNEGYNLLLLCVKQDYSDDLLFKMVDMGCSLLNDDPAGDLCLKLLTLAFEIESAFKVINRERNKQLKLLAA